MYETERIIAWITVFWAVISLCIQWISAWGGGRKDYSVQAGSIVKGMIYNFTWAMTPRHKETIRLHPIQFLIGILMHIGVFIAIINFFFVLVNPQSTLFNSAIINVILGIAAHCAGILFLKRIFSKGLRSMSSPDDYLSVLITLDFISAAIAHGVGLISSGAFMIHSAVMFFYMPIGKLKHALFFFIARADYGARLGYRGTYPAKD